MLDSAQIDDRSVFRFDRKNVILFSQVFLLVCVHFILNNERVRKTENNTLNY